MIFYIKAVRHELVPSFARDTIKSLDKIQYFDIPRVFNNLTSKFVKIFQKYLHCYILFHKLCLEKRKMIDIIAK